MMVSFLPLLLVFVVFYFLLIRPQQQKAKEHKTRLANLKKNDEVVTGGGLYGKVIALGKTQGIPTPVNLALYRLIKAIERGYDPIAAV